MTLKIVLGVIVVLAIIAYVVNRSFNNEDCCSLDKPCETKPTSSLGIPVAKKVTVKTVKVTKAKVTKSAKKS